MFNEPLGLPRGSVRALITLLLLLTVCTAVLTNVSLPLWMGDITLGAVAYYLGSRVGANTKTEN